MKGNRPPGAGRISVFMPAFNAERHLAATFDRIPPELMERIHAIWIVDDGSTDGTAAVIRKLATRESAVRPLAFAHNRGYGAAVGAALQRIRDEPVDAAVCLHADGQYAPELMGTLLDAMASRRLDIVQGSRLASGGALAGRMPLYKYAAGHILTLIENLTFRMRMTDYHSGYLCYSRHALDAIPFDRLSASFDFDLEAIACARALGLRIGEVPIPTHYGDEISHLNPVAYGLRVLRIMWRYAGGNYRARGLHAPPRVEESTR
jgi:glycosyltransferase involved in cell wall biosynthesis